MPQVIQIEQFLESFDEQTRDLRNTLALKNADYANTKDVYANFNRVAMMTGLPVRSVFLVMIGIKVARLSELATGKEVKNEPMADSLLDLVGYAMLWKVWEEYGV
jgi:hypothetical protein